MMDILRLKKEALTDVLYIQHTAIWFFEIMF